MKLALITSPFMAIYGLSPVYIFTNIPTTLFLKGIMFVTIGAFTIWSFNIFLLNSGRFKLKQRYAISYLLTITMIAFMSVMPETIIKRPYEINNFHPFLASFAINTLVLIIIQGRIVKLAKDKAEQEIQALKIKNMEAQQNLLMRQFQPHFLFNALSTLKSLMNSNIEEAEEYLLKLSSFLRFSVEVNNETVVALEKELEFTQYYLDMQQIRFEGALFCDIKVDKSLLKMKIPVFALQSLVENAIKHNGFSVESPLYITIKGIGHLEGVRYLYIQNNKIPKTQFNSTKTGLKALNKRHEMITNESIEIIDTENEFKVILKLT